MTLKQLASLGKELAKFLALFAGCFRSRPGFALCKIYVQGLLSNLPRKNVEAIALEFDTPPRTLQRFVESIKWEEAQVRDECQRLIARDHAHAEAIGCLDESGTAKSGTHTVGAARQWLGSLGKVDNGVVGVHLSYCAPGFQCLLDSELYLTQEVANDPVRRQETYVPDDVVFRTKPQIGLELVDRALGHGVRVQAWTFDEAYGRDTAFLDGLETRGQVFVGEVPTDFHGWVRKPKVLRTGVVALFQEIPAELVLFCSAQRPESRPACCAAGQKERLFPQQRPTAVFATRTSAVQEGRSHDAA